MKISLEVPNGTPEEAHRVPQLTMVPENDGDREKLEDIFQNHNKAVVGFGRDLSMRLLHLSVFLENLPP